MRELENRLISMKYNLIDLSFLEMSSKVEIEKNEFIVPKFTAYEFYGSNNFKIGFRHLNKYAIEIAWPLFDKKGPNLKKYLERMYKKEGFDLEDNGPHHSSMRNPQCNFSFPLKEDVILTANFTGLIPSEVKENVKKSLNYFGKKGIYLITETKPEQWNVKFITKDPLVIGMKNNQAYLIDHFNTTKLENLVKDTYTNLQ